MRLVIFGVPNQVSEEEIISAVAAAAEVLGVNIHCSILDRKDILPPADEPIFISRKEESEYIQAVKKVIEEPILDVLAFGPKSGRELAALKDAGGQEFISICRTALALSKSL